MKKQKKLTLEKTTVKDLKIQTKVKAGLGGFTNFCNGGGTHTGNTGGTTD